MSQDPTIGRVVHYRLSREDAESVNKRRSDTEAHLEEHRELATGVQVHVGFPVVAGDAQAAIIVGIAVSGNPNLKVLLDGTDVLWVPDAGAGHADGQWSWPPRI
ncbi:hypothetical protein ACF07D_07615 [Leucobacter sp. NPDC015123]|uniref:hypothetical protein n=1 Tax=Leucobacter sp. NPDC015123 TaxID=3364129 RepID=UPI0036F4929C